MRQLIIGMLVIVSIAFVSLTGWWAYDWFVLEPRREAVARQQLEEDTINRRWEYFQRTGIALPSNDQMIRNYERAKRRAEIIRDAERLRIREAEEQR